MKKDKVSIIMGSQSDWKTLQSAENILNDFKISNEVKIVSAHRTPERLYRYAKNAHKNNIKVIIAGAGGAGGEGQGARGVEDSRRVQGGNEGAGGREDEGQVPAREDPEVPAERHVRDHLRRARPEGGRGGRV